MDKEAGSTKTTELLIQEQLIIKTYYEGSDKERKIGNRFFMPFIFV